MAIIQYTGSGENPGTFDFPASDVVGFLEELVQNFEQNTRDPQRIAAFRIYSELFEEIVDLTLSTPHDILELDQDSRMDFLAAALIEKIDYIVFCPECVEEYPSAKVRKDLVVDPADPYAPHNGRSYQCPKRHEVLFVPDLIK